MTKIEINSYINIELADIPIINSIKEFAHIFLNINTAILINQGRKLCILQSNYENL